MKRIRTIGELRPKVAIDDELDWFFNRADGDMGDQSNYLAMLGREGPGSEIPSPEQAVEAAHRARCIRGWLRAMTPVGAGVLQCAYELRAWPVVLWDALGRATGVVVRLACALDPIPEDRGARHIMEMGRAGWLAAQCAPGSVSATVARLRRQGQERLMAAQREYIALRSRPSPRRRCL